MTTTATPCTDEQKADWHELHERMRDLSRRKESAERDILTLFRMHVDAGAMLSGPFGVPSDDAVKWYAKACEAAVEAKRLRAEWEALYAESQAHPYTAEVNARREAQA